MDEDDDLSLIGDSIQKIANAIMPLGVSPGHDETGGTVCSLTESIMGITAALCRIAESIDKLADAISKKS